MSGINKYYTIKEKIMKSVYILFSGGYDSSYLVNKVLQNIKDNHQEEEVALNLISAKCSFSGDKSEREHNARNRLVEYWRSKYYDNIINQLKELEKKRLEESSGNAMLDKTIKVNNEFEEMAKNIDKNSQ